MTSLTALFVLALCAVAAVSAMPPIEYNVEQPQNSLAPMSSSSFEELVQHLDDMLDGREELPELSNGVAMTDEVDESELSKRQKRACRRIVIISRHGRRIVIIKC